MNSPMASAFSVKPYRTAGSLCHNMEDCSTGCSYSHIVKIKLNQEQHQLCDGMGIKDEKVRVCIMVAGAQRHRWSMRGMPIFKMKDMKKGKG